IVNWGEAFVARYDGKEWKRHEASLGRDASLVEIDGAVHLFSGKRVYSIDGQGALSSRELDLPQDVKLSAPVLLGDRRLLVRDNQRYKLYELKLPDFKLSGLG